MSDQTQAPAPAPDPAPRPLDRFVGTGDIRDAVDGSLGTELPLAPSVVSAGLVLREQGMPVDELHVVLWCEDAEIVRRHLALHVERMEEQLVEQRKRAQWAERLLTLPARRRDQSVS